MDIQHSLTQGSETGGREDVPRLSLHDPKIVCDGNAGIYLAAERSMDRRRYVTIWKINLATKIWKQFSLENVHIFTMRQQHLVFLDENRLFVYLKKNFDISLYHIDKDSTGISLWEKIACTGEKPSVNYGMFKELNEVPIFDRDKRCLYVVSVVTRANAEFEIRRLSTTDWNWEKLSTISLWNDHLHCPYGIVILDETIYMLGCKRSGSRITDLNQIVTFSVKSRSWTLLQVSLNI